MRPIDADALMPMMRYATIDSEVGVFPIKIGFDAIAKVINAQPTIERKTGRWIDMDDHVMCSCCGATHYGADKNYCPNCGSYNGG